MSLHFELLGDYAAWMILGVLLGYFLRMIQERVTR